MKICIHCQSAETRKWYSGPTCRNCYRRAHNQTEAGKAAVRRCNARQRARPGHAERKHRDYLKYRDWYLNNCKEWRAKNRGRWNEICMARYVAKLRAMPAWVDREVIRKIYETCPKGWHVDHIIPLQGENVCGLHVPWNLQHLPATDNIRKSNKIEDRFKSYFSRAS